MENYNLTINTFKGLPFKIFGSLFNVCVWNKNKNQCVTLKIGCKELIIDEWIKQGESVAKEYNVECLIPEYKRYINIFKSFQTELYYEEEFKNGVLINRYGE